MSNPVTFASLGVPAEIVAALAADGKTEPFRIQAETLTDTLAGRDVIGSGKTGSGKTLAFAIPLVAGLAERRVRRTPGAPTGLILAPTRELATQIAAVVVPLAKTMNLSVTTVFGGVSQKRQEDAFRRGVDIVVACPGRLEDLIGQRIVRLDQVAITILDEADHMADLGFLPGVTRILAATPDGGQRMLFTATLDNGVDKVARRFLNKPSKHSTEDSTAPVATMTHHVFEVAPDAKNALINELASGLGRRILFTRTKFQAKKLAKKLTDAGIPAVDLHGNLSQAQRDRNLKAFSEDVRVLVATDVAARGVHVDGVELVVHVDPPAEHKAYLHRSGRTARAGNDGDVVTICLPDQRRDLAVLLRRAGIGVKPIRVTAASPEVTGLVGEHAEFVAPTPKPAVSEGRGSGGRSGGRSAGGRGSGRRRGAGQGRSAEQGRSGHGRSDREPRPARSGEGSSGQSRSDRQHSQSGRPARSGHGSGAPRRNRAGQSGRRRAATHS